MIIPEEQHNIEIHQNLKYWESKPVLQAIYRNFYETIALKLKRNVEGKIVELGSGIGNFKSVISECICTDLFPNPWLDQVENAYSLSFANESVSNLILFDVWHHLQFPGTALAEFHRVLKNGGRVIIFEPAISALGFVAYGLLHHEPIGWRKPITWNAPPDFDPNNSAYYAAQGNATRIFKSKQFDQYLNQWDIVETSSLSAVSYILSGGYSKPQLYPTKCYPLMKNIDKALDEFPKLFATRLLITLEKKG